MLGVKLGGVREVLLVDCQLSNVVTASRDYCARAGGVHFVCAKTFPH
jgi:hypothetical protein